MAKREIFEHSFRYKRKKYKIVGQNLFHESVRKGVVSLNRIEDEVLISEIIEYLRSKHE